MKWKMVPVEPTEKMADAGWAVRQFATIEKTWAAMLKAAPAPWIPLDPRSEGHRFPTADDASGPSDEQVLCVDLDGFIKSVDWWRADFPRWGWWMPMIQTPVKPGPEDSE